MSSSARRALKILAAVGEAGRPMGVTEIARTLGIAPGTAFRGLDALQSAGLLARQPSASRFVLGPATLGLRQSLLSLFRIRDVCLPYLRQLASASGEATSLHVRIGWYSARVAVAPGTAEVTSGVILKGAQLLSADPAGRVILAHLPRTQVACFLACATARAIVIPERFERDLAELRTGGFASESGPESGVLAVPIRKSDQAFAAVTMDGAAFAGGFASDDRIAECRAVALAIEALVRANPELCRQPFEHIEPDDLMLPS
jgi:IclR family acetate operon transcriptional repressor